MGRRRSGRPDAKYDSHRADNQESHPVGFEPVAPGESPSEVLVRHEIELQLADAIAALSDDYQEVIVLRNLERLPFDEVARRMGRSRPAVQMLWMRAIRSLKAEGLRASEM